LQLAIAPREIASVTRDDEDDLVAYRMRLACGHVFWLAVPPVREPMRCIVCVDVAVEAVHAARRPAREPTS
jgi:hypothetical protein